MWAPAASPGEWSQLVPEDPAVRVWSVEAFARGYVLHLRRDGAAMLRVVPREGAPFDVVPEHAGGMARLGRNDEWDAAFVTVAVESFVHPTVWWDVAWDGTRVQRHRREALGVDSAAYVCERHLVPRPDGVQVPVVLMLSLIHI